MRRSISKGILLPLQVCLTLIIFFPALLLLTVLRAINKQWAAAIYREMALTNDQFTRFRHQLAGEFVWDHPGAQTSLIRARPSGLETTAPAFRIRSAEPREPGEMTAPDSITVPRDH